MDSLRPDPPREFAGKKVLAVRDYLKSERVCGSETQPLTLPKSDVLYYELQDKAWICVRPSGTEALIRVMVEAGTQELAEAAAATVVRSVENAQN